MLKSVVSTLLTLLLVPLLYLLALLNNASILALSISFLALAVLTQDFKASPI